MRLAVALVLSLLLVGALGQERRREERDRDVQERDRAAPREDLPRAENATARAEEERPQPREAETQAAREGQYPSAAFDIYILGAHWNPVDIREQRIVHHFCNVVDRRTSLIQCALYDGNSTDARLIGVEYVVGREAAEQLPVEERKLWHSHAFEVRSGLLNVPEMSGDEEMEFLGFFANTYGKIYHTWRHTDLPVGLPSIDMSFTAEGQVNPEISERTDAIVGTTARERAEEREDIDIKPQIPGVDFWQSGAAVQLGGLHVQVDRRANTTLPDYVEKEEPDAEDLERLQPRGVVAFPPLTGKGTPAQPFMPETGPRRRGPPAAPETFRSRRATPARRYANRRQLPQAYYQPAPSFPARFVPVPVGYGYGYSGR